MGRAIAEYFRQLTQHFGDGWNRFWFAPSDPSMLAVIRILAGLVAIYTIATYSFDLVGWFGESGMFEITLIDQLYGPGTVRLSYLDGFSTPGELWTVHALGLIVLVLFTLGVKTRITSVLALIVVLSYVHRAPMVTGTMEPILTMVMFYLCLGPAGACLSIDALLARKKQALDKTRREEDNAAPLHTTSATIVTRLIQVHLCLVYLMMGLAKIAEPGDSWWLGESVWWLMANPESRLIDLTGLFHNHPHMVNFWSHVIVLFEASFAVMIWNRWARPLLLAIAVPLWISIALITGMSGLAIIMLIANLSFVPACVLRACCSTQPNAEPAQQAAAA